MRCKHHPTDLTSAVGVCATCLRHRLLTLIDEQTRLEEALAVAKQLATSCPTDGRHKLPEPHPLPFPRSVSPYVGSRRSSDHKYLHRFFSTPQVGPAYDAACGFGVAENTMEVKRKKLTKFAFFKNLFRSRSDKYNSDRSVCSKMDQRFPVSPHRDSSSSDWLSFLHLRRKKKPALEEKPSRSNNCRRPCRISNRGMSPERGIETDDYFDSGYSSESSSHGPRRTPVMAVTPMRRKRRGGLSKSTSGMAFCLSPLVRASPGRQWSQKGTMQPEIGATGEVRIMGKPYLSTAASFNGNRSRKLVDLGRVNPNR